MDGNAKPHFHCQKYIRGNILKHHCRFIAVHIHVHIHILGTWVLSCLLLDDVTIVTIVTYSVQHCIRPVSNIIKYITTGIKPHIFLGSFGRCRRRRCRRRRRSVAQRRRRRRRGRQHREVTKFLLEQDGRQCTSSCINGIGNLRIIGEIK